MDPAVTLALATPRNADPAELEKFSALAHRWWDPNSEFRPLHEINPLRLEWIDRLAGGLGGKRVVDVGCGGGILAEAMASRGADVTGIDLSDKALGVARLHQLESGVAVDYRLVAAEALAQEIPAASSTSSRARSCWSTRPEPASVVEGVRRALKARRPRSSSRRSTAIRKSYAFRRNSSAPNTCSACCRAERTTGRASCVPRSSPGSARRVAPRARRDDRHDVQPAHAHATALRARHVASTISRRRTRRPAA